MKVLIGITSKNRAAILPKAINSALDQDHPDKEVVIYDDASTDDTAQLEPKFPQAKWIISTVPRGLMYARNFFLTVSDAEIFCSLDDDAWFLNDNALSIAVKYMEEHMDVAAVAFDILSPDDVNKVQIDSVEPIETNMYIGCGHLLRIAIVKQLGGYPVSPGLYGGEEKDLCLRLIEAGYKIVRLNGLYVWHDKTQLARNFKGQYRSVVCNDLVFAYRRTPLSLLLPSLFSKIYKHLKYAVNYKKDALIITALKGIGDFLIYLVTFRLDRDPVSVKGLKKYLGFNK